MAKINISIDDALLAKIDRLADESYTSRSGFISMGMSQFVQSKEVISAIQSMSVSMARIASSNEIDAETKKELAEFKMLCDFLGRTN